MSNWKERKKKRYEESLEYIKKFFSSDILDGVIIKVDASEDMGLDYEKKTGIAWQEEETLTVIDDDNNVYLVFEKEEDKTVIKKDITEKIHVIDKYDFDCDSIIHKKCGPAKLPAHLEVHLTIVNNNIGIQYNTMNNLNNLSICGEEDFFKKNYKKGGMCSLKEMKHHSEWMNKYMNNIEVKAINICRSCKNKSRRGCCNEYNPKNRIKLKMVIGWHI